MRYPNGNNFQPALVPRLPISPGEYRMVQSKRTKLVRSPRTTHRSRGKRANQTGTKELVLTLSIPDGEVVKVEMLDKSGQRRQLPEEELADLAGEDEEEISPEEAYAAGIADASEEDEFDLDEQGSADEDALERFVLREMIVRQLLRRGVRRFILRRLGKRQLIRSQGRPEGGAVHEGGSKAHTNGYQGPGDEA